MKMALIFLLGFSAVGLARVSAQSSVPYDHVAPVIGVVESKTVGGLPCGQFLIRFNDPAHDATKGNFRMETATGDVVPLLVEALPNPEKECTHAIWIPNEVNKYRGAVLKHDFPKGSIMVKAGGLLESATEAGAEALKAALKELFMSRERLGPDHTQTLIAMRKAASVLEKNKYTQPAEYLARQAAAGLEKNEGKNHMETIHARSVLGEILKGRDKAAGE